MSPRLRGWALHSDGDRIAAARFPPVQNTRRQNSVVIVFDFFDELRRRFSPGSQQN